MRIDVHSHFMSVAFLEHLQGRHTPPSSVREGSGFVEAIPRSKNTLSGGCASGAGASALSAIRVGPPAVDRRSNSG
jgi:hypothetical protein